MFWQFGFILWIIIILILLVAAKEDHDEGLQAEKNDDRKKALHASARDRVVFRGIVIQRRRGDR